MNKLAQAFKRYPKAFVGIAFVLLASLILFLMMLESNQNNSSTDVSVSDSAGVYTFTEASNYIANPGIGWQYMGSSDRTILSETVAYPDRQDISWKILQTGDGVYNWNALDTRINTAVSQGKQISFRIYSMRGESFGGHQVPQFVIDKGMKFDGASPNYSDCIYQDEWGKFVEALRARYDGNKNIAYIDISGYGDFNEWSYIAQTQWEDDFMNPKTTDGFARNRLVDTFLGGSSTTHNCSLNGVTQTRSYSFPGFSQTQLIMPYAGTRQSVYYAAAKSQIVGFRNDCLGAPGFDLAYFKKLDGIFNTRWKTAPFVFELCQINWNDSNFQTRMRDALNYTHGSMVHDNPNGSAQPKATIENLMKRVGYRYFLRSAKVPTIVQSNQPLAIELEWLNTGLAPSYPRMGQNFVLEGHLINANKDIVKTWQISSDISKWFPNDDVNLAPTPNVVSADLSTSGIALGEYVFGVNIKDVRTNKYINLANINTTNANNGMFYSAVGPVVVSSTSTTTPPPTTPTGTNNQYDIQSMVVAPKASYLVGENFVVEFKAVVPQGGSVYASEIEFIYDSNLLELQSTSVPTGLLSTNEVLGTGIGSIDIVHEGVGNFANNETLYQLTFKVTSESATQASVTLSGNSTIGDNSLLKNVVAKVLNLQIAKTVVAEPDPVPDVTPDPIPDPVPTTPVCGNGIVEAGEQCDDGNLANGDTCSSTCTIVVPTPTVCLGDYNIDGRIDIKDFAIFGQNYKVNGVSCIYNLTGEACYLDIADFQFFANRYGKLCSELN